MTTKENKGELSLALEVMDQQPVRSPMTPVAQPQTAAGTPLALLQYAMANGGASLDQLERLMAMQRAYEADEARKAFNKAKADFAAEEVRVKKDKLNKQFDSRYSSIGSLVNTARPFLSKHGLSADWIPGQDGGALTVTCKLSHALGHSESVTLEVPKDTSGAKNPLQQIKSSLTYAKIATFEMVTGLASDEDPGDDDGNGFTTDIRLADEWIAKLPDCKTDAEAVKMWQQAVKAFAKDKLGLKEFEEAFVARRAVLQGGAQ